MKEPVSAQVGPAELDGLRLHARAIAGALRALKAGEPSAVDGSRRLARSLAALNAVPAITEAARNLSSSRPEDVETALELVVSLLAVCLPPPDAREISRVLVVSQDDDFVSGATRELATDGHRIVTPGDFRHEALVADSAGAELIVVDGDLRPVSPRDLVLDLRTRRGVNGPPLIVVSSARTLEDPSEWFALGASAYLTKPVAPGLLVATTAAQLYGKAERSKDSLVDVLTGLPNRRAFSEELERVLGAASRQQRTVSIAIVDLDHFKSVNDTYGHGAGDEVLRRVSAVIPAEMRTIDLLARWGGEEFVALFPETGRDSAARVLERALGAVRAEQFTSEDGRTFKVTFSAGVAEVDPDVSVEEAVAQADRLLYIAKTSGRDRVIVGQSHEATQKLASAMDEIAQAERRQLTVVDIDLVGKVEEVELLTLDQRSEFVRNYHSATINALNAFGGHVAQDLGTGLLVYFGYPLAQEDDAERAVRAGLAVIESVEGLLSESRDEFDTGLSATIGIHTGPVVVYVLGGTGREQRRRRGRTARVAAEMRSIGVPGTVVVSETTARLLESSFETTRIEHPEGTRAGAPTVAYQIVRERSRDRDGEAVQHRGRSLIGREAEVMLLHERIDQALEGLGQITLLGGDAGIGKSRLVSAVNDRAAKLSHAWLEGRCSAYHGDSALYPIIELFRGALKRHDGNGESGALKDLEALAVRCNLELEEAVPLLAPAFGMSVPKNRYAPPVMTLEKKRQRLWEMLIAILVEIAARQPLFLVIEDLHWADHSTLEFLSKVIDHVPTAPVFMLCTYRPDFRSPWNPRTYLTYLTLGRLPDRHVHRIISEIASNKQLPSEVSHHIVAKTDGIPMFVEELTKTVLESKVLVDKGEHYELASTLTGIMVPSSLRGTLMSRLDRLQSAKTVAQIAAIIGRQFSYELLRAVYPGDEAALSRELARLLDAELLYRQQMRPSVTYMFKHALIQETIYETMLDETRQTHHGRVASVLQAQFPEIVQAHPELLAHHLNEAGQYIAAITFWRKAGEGAIQRFANVEALAHLGRAVKLVQHLPTDAERDREELDIQTLLGPTLLASKGFASVEVEDAYTRARLLAERMNDIPRLAVVLRGMWALYLVRARLETSRSVAEQVLALGEQCQDDGYELEARRPLAQSLFYLGDFQGARENLERVFELYDEDRHGGHRLRYGSDSLVVSSSYLAWTLWFQGYPDQALQRSHEAVDRARLLGHPFTLAQTLTNALYVHQLRGEVDLTLRCAEDSIEYSKKLGFPYWASISAIMRGWAQAHLTGGESGIEDLELGLAAYENSGSQVALPWFMSLCAEVKASAGQLDEALSLTAQAMEQVQRAGERFYEAELHRCQGELAMRRSATASSQLESCFLRALEIARGQAARSLELRAATSLSRLWRERGNLQAARELLAPLYASFEEGHDTHDLQQARRELELLG
ncbi:MAG: diguanylate cyclase [Gammaproteobacteria bacterium]